MSRHGYAVLSLTRVSDSEALDDLILRAEKAGLSLAHPVTGEISILSEEGDSLRTTRTGVLDAYRCSGRVTFDLWAKDSLDALSVSCGDKPGWSEELFILRGLDGMRLDVAKRVFLQHSAELHRRARLVWMVFDAVGSCLDYDWDALIESGASPQDVATSEGIRTELTAADADLLLSDPDSRVLWKSTLIVWKRSAGAVLARPN